ncbi:unnamed protein product [Closterium sp. NIES-53]
MSTRSKHLHFPHGRPSNPPAFLTFRTSYCHTTLSLSPSSIPSALHRSASNALPFPPIPPCLSPQYRPASPPSASPPLTPLPPRLSPLCLPASHPSCAMQLSRWHVQPYSSQPGVYLLQQPTDFACVLLIQDACYLFMEGKASPLSTCYHLFMEGKASPLSTCYHLFMEGKASPLSTCYHLFMEGKASPLSTCYHLFMPGKASPLSTCYHLFMPGKASSLPFPTCHRLFMQGAVLGTTLPMCHLNMRGKSKHHQPHTGIWFARDRIRDLSQISIVNNVCHLYSDRLADALYESWLELSWHELAAALEREAVHGKGVRRERGEAGVGGRGERGGTEGRGRERQAFWKGRRKGRGAERAGGGAEGEEVGAGGMEVGAGGVGGGMSVEDVKEVARLHAAAVRKRKAVMAAAAASGAATASAAAGETSTQQENSKGGSRNGRNKGRSNGSNNKGSSSNGGAWAQYHVTMDQHATGDNGLGYSLDALDAPEALEASDGPVMEPVRLRDPSDDWTPPGTGAKAQEAKAGERAGRGVTGGGGGGRERVEVGLKGGKVSGKGGTRVRGGGGGRESGRKVEVKVVSVRRKLLGIWGSRQRHSRGRRTQQSHRRSSSSSNAANTTTFTTSSSSASVSSRSKYHLPQMHPLQPRHTAMDNLADGFAQEPDEQPPVDLSDLKRRSLHTYGRLTNHLAMTRYVGVSERRSRETLVRGMRGRRVRVGVVARYGSAVGEFGRALVPLMEVAGHLEGSLQAQANTGQLGGQQREEERQEEGRRQGQEQQGGGQQGGGQQRRGDEGVVVFFPGDDSIRSQWTMHAARLLFGDATRVEAGRVAGQKVCFQNLLLPINKLHRPHSADLTRRRASQASQAMYGTQTSQATQNPAATLHTPRPTHSHTEPLPGTPTIPTIQILPGTPHQDAQGPSLAPALALMSQAVSIQAVSLQAMASATGDNSGRRGPSMLQEGAGAVMERGERVGGEGNYENGSESRELLGIYERRILPKLAIHASPEERLAVGVAALPLGDKRRAAALANPLAAAAAAAAAGGAAGGVGVEEAGRRTDVGSKLREGVEQKQQDVGAKGKSSGKGKVNEQGEEKREKERKRLAGVERREDTQGEEEDPVADAEAMARQELDDYLDQYEEQHSANHDNDHDHDSHRHPLPTDTNFPTTSNRTLPSLATAEPGATGIESSPPSSTGALQLLVPTQRFLYLLPDRGDSGRLTGSTGKDSWQVTLVERDNVEGLKNQQEVVALIQEAFPELPVAIVRLGNVSLYDQVTIMKVSKLCVVCTVLPHLLN